jgi:hypothetical protein
MMTIAIGIIGLIFAFMAKEIVREWLGQKEKNIQTDFAKDDFNQAKKLNKLNTEIDDYVEENGELVQLKDIRKKLRGKSTATAQ